MKIVNLFFLLVFTVLSSNVWASEDRLPIADADDPNFQQVLEVWLNGNDSAALNELAKMANEDHLAAQIFLGQIVGRASHTSRDLLDGLGRDDRRAITRKNDGSRRGKSWLWVAEDRHPLAWALVNVQQPETLVQALSYLLDHDEKFPQWRGINSLINWQEMDSLFRFAAEGKIDEIYRPWVAMYIRGKLLLGKPVPGGPNGALVQEYAKIGDVYTSPAEHEFLFWGRPPKILFDLSKGVYPGYPESLVDNASLFNRLQGISLSDVRMKPLLGLCKRICPKSAAACTVALKAHQHSFGRTLSRTHSPVEALVSTSKYRASVRFPADIRRVLSDSKQDPEALRPVDACFADFLLAK
ncbi:hypothetical protein [Ahrensia sp. R2A130]|uniref:hypothetical protein n=1 Tax=Ahrensia sp. R2A130 TaxID=744979 RepID=UPI0001E0AC55|nr:hypothetical protein [Ahrensia sp. R2A130]EFL90113.1 conserved hypothetical protein [Ahrensia sp. R2A130]